MKFYYPYVGSTPQFLLCCVFFNAENGKKKRCTTHCSKLTAGEPLICRPTTDTAVLELPPA